MHDALQRLERGIESGAIQGYTPQARQAIWHRVICLAGSIPRPRTSKGQYPPVAGSARGAS
jgi:hypothetical protein